MAFIPPLSGVRVALEAAYAAADFDSYSLEYRCDELSIGQVLKAPIEQSALLLRNVDIVLKQFCKELGIESRTDPPLGAELETLAGIIRRCIEQVKASIGEGVIYTFPLLEARRIARAMMRLLTRELKDMAAPPWPNRSRSLTSYELLRANHPGSTAIN